MAAADLLTWALVAGTVALFAAYFVHVALRLRNGVNALKALPGALERAFDGDVPPWLRLVRVVMIFVICLVAALLIASKFKLVF